MKVNFLLLPNTDFQAAAKMMPTPILAQQAHLAAHLLIELVRPQTRPITNEALDMWRRFEFSLGSYAYNLLEELWKREDHDGTGLTADWVLQVYRDHPHVVVNAATAQAESASIQAPLPAWTQDPNTIQEHRKLLDNWIKAGKR